MSSLGAKSICLSRIISKDSVKSIDEVYGNEYSMRILKNEIQKRGKKGFKNFRIIQNDGIFHNIEMHLILDLPINYFDESNYQDVIEFWFQQVDGIRLISDNVSIYFHPLKFDINLLVLIKEKSRFTNCSKLDKID